MTLWMKHISQESFHNLLGPIGPVYFWVKTAPLIEEECITLGRLYLIFLERVEHVSDNTSVLKRWGT